MKNLEFISIAPDNYKQFGEAEGATFCLVISPEIFDNFVMEKQGKYKKYEKISTEHCETFEQILKEKIPEIAHILVISPQEFFKSVSPEILGKQRKLAVLASNSTLTSLEAIKHFVNILEKSDPNEQEEFAQKFFTLAGESQYLKIIDKSYGTEAKFFHKNQSYQWFEQAGMLDWGCQQIVPSGEISVLPLKHGSYNENERLLITGEIAFKGTPILHSGKTSFLREDQQRIYKSLSLIDEHALIAQVKNGVIDEIYATHNSVKPALQMLLAMFDVDSRYRIIWEIGLGINTQLELLPGNQAMNEVYGGNNGVIHWGLGLTPWTPYHLDIICPESKILTETGRVIIGDED